MSHANGDLDLIPLENILQGAPKRQLTGTLRLTRESIEKTFYYCEGKAIFVVSNLPGERIGEFLDATGCLNLQRARDAMAKSAQGESPPDLLQEKVFEREELESALRQLILIALAEALRWECGTFELTDTLPPSLLNAPVRVEVPDALDQALRLNAAGGPSA